MTQAEADMTTGDAGSTERKNPVTQMTARRRVQARADQDALAQAFRVAFGRMARDIRGLDAVADQVRLWHGSLAELVEIAEPGTFLVMLEGPGDRMGLAIACPGLLSAMIEALTTGRLSVLAPAPRKPTRTDAALAIPLIESLLSQITQRLEGNALQRSFSSVVPGSFLADPRPLGLLLEDVGFQLVRLDIALGAEGRRGSLHLALPEPAAASDDATAGPAAMPDHATWTARMEAAVAASEVQLDAVLYRLRMPLSDLGALSRGDVICLPETALESLSIETIDGRQIAQARLGQARGHRALRLTTSPGTIQDPPVPPPARAMVLSAPASSPASSPASNPASNPAIDQASDEGAGMEVPADITQHIDAGTGPYQDPHDITPAPPVEDGTEILSPVPDMTLPDEDAAGFKDDGMSE